MIQLTHAVKGKAFPLDSNDFKTEKEGQVAGLGGGNLKKILKEHGITQLLSSEGGRTSRGSMGYSTVEKVVITKSVMTTRLAKMGLNDTNAPLCSFHPLFQPIQLCINKLFTNAVNSVDFQDRCLKLKMPDRNPSR